MILASSHGHCKREHETIVTGATGKQGRGVLDALLAQNNHARTTKWRVLALTRGTGAALQNVENVTVVQGNLDDCAAIFATVRRVLGDDELYGVYSVQVAFGRGSSNAKEILQGIGRRGRKGRREALHILVRRPRTLERARREPGIS